MGYWEKHSSSRPLTAQVIQLSSAVAVNSSPFGSQTYQIRVISPIAIWAAIDSATVTAQVQPLAAFFSQPTLEGDYFTVNPGQTISCRASLARSDVVQRHATAARASRGR